MRGPPVPINGTEPRVKLEIAKLVVVAAVVVALLAVKSCRVVEPREEREPAGKTKEPEPKVPPVMVEAA